MLVSTSEGLPTRFSWLPLILFILFQVLSQFPLIRWTFLTDQLKVVNSPMEALDLLKAGDYSSLDVEAFRCPVNQAGQDLVLLDKYFIIIIIIDTFKGASSTMLPKTLERTGWPWQKSLKKRRSRRLKLNKA